MSIKRYFLVRTAHGRTAHRAEHITEGYFTFCGRELKLGMQWMRGGTKLRRCKRCFA